jgi:hypothetical protein
MKCKILFKILINLVFIFLFSAVEVFGCMCDGQPSVSDEYNRATSVIIGKIKRFENQNVGQKVTLQVVKSFKGSSAKELIVKQPYSSCGWTFRNSDKAKEYLFYLFQDTYKDYVIGGFCSRVSEIKNAHDDLAWLNDLPKSLNRTRISGVVQLLDEYFPIAGINIKIVGNNKEYQTVTDKNGLYEIWDLPNGRYKIEPQLPEKYQIGWTLNAGDTFISELPSQSNKYRIYSVDLKTEKTGGINYYLVKTK